MWRPLETSSMQFEAQLRTLLRRRSPVVPFVYSVGGSAAPAADESENQIVMSRREISAGLFFGSARSIIEAKLYAQTGAEEGQADAADEEALKRFVDEITGMQSDPATTHEAIAKHLVAKKYSLTIADAQGETDGVLAVSLGPRTVRMPEPQSDSGIKDLALVLLLRFGAFQGGEGNATIGDGTRAVLGANLVFAFLFKGVHEENAQASLRASMVSTGGADYIGKAGELLTSTRHLEGAERVVSDNLRSVRAATRTVVMESASITVLAATLLLVVWLRGGVVLSSHRTGPWIASVCILMYILARMLWLHMPSKPVVRGQP